MNKSQLYVVHVYCINCGIYEDDVKISLGIPVSEMLCQNCGCKFLRRSE